ncbi:GntR family transcriptional regulator [Ostreibacterium oceani]|uniref:GntR family transcriptional regulator n=1 Tax=Ostreibacterium oceani TaxID=2654998 RepID=A0A6N7EWT9_9GAMM|nr:GntR family transcriptional regulator [Ostreibacterium oceani]MPV86010.1 GntR family transcriptional regulator [Ostreibacterium oceani]
MFNLHESRNDAQQRFYEVYSTLRKRICLLEYEPGKRLSEHALAEEFNISRTPIRRVLTTLENEGMVEIRHGAGNYVSTVELDYLCDIYAMRMELVMLIPQKLKSPMPDSVLQQMQQLLIKSQQINQNQSPQHAFAEINLELFEITLQAIDSRALCEMLSLLFYKSARMWPFLLKDNRLLKKETDILSEEITDLTRVLQAGHHNSIATILRFHIECALYRLQQYCLAQNPSTAATAKAATATAATVKTTTKTKASAPKTAIKQ